MFRVNIRYTQKKDGDMNSYMGCSGNQKIVTRYQRLVPKPEMRLKVCVVNHRSTTKLVTPGSSMFQLNTDALVTSDHKLALAVPFADCTPLILFCPQSTLLAVAHCSAKSLKAGVVRSVCEKMEKYGANLKTIQAQTGPGLCPDCYKFSKKDLPTVKKLHYREAEQDTTKVEILISETIRQALKNQGVDAVILSEQCTKCSVKYFSWRNDKANGLKSPRCNLAIATLTNQQ